MSFRICSSILQKKKQLKCWQISQLFSHFWHNTGQLEGKITLPPISYSPLPQMVPGQNRPTEEHGAGGTVHGMAARSRDSQEERKIDPARPCPQWLVSSYQWPPNVPVSDQLSSGLVPWSNHLPKPSSMNTWSFERTFRYKLRQQAWH